MNEFIMHENAQIEAAIAAMRSEPSREFLAVLTESICMGINTNARLIIPVAEPQEEVDAATEDTKLSIRKVRLKDGRRALVAFTTLAELEKGEPSASMMQTLKLFLTSVSEMEDADGVVLNPWGTSYFLSKAYIATLLEFNEGFDPNRRVFFVEGDITQLDCDCIVNAANKTLLGGGGVDGAIHRAAGPELLEECRTLGGCETGEAKLTGGYNLKAKYVIHTVGPVYSGKPEDRTLLESCYRNSLELAKANGIRSIAFPAISTGAYGYPMEEAAPIALSTVDAWLQDNSDCGMSVVFSCYDRSVCDLYAELYKAIEEERKAAGE